MIVDPDTGSRISSSPLRQWRLHPRLPIHAISDGSDRVVLYTPGHLGVTDQPAASRLKAAWQSSGLAPGLPPTEAATASALVAAAEETTRRWEVLLNRPFQPEALTIELEGPCELGCAYCYLPHPRHRKILHVEAIRAASDWVAQTCVALQAPLACSLHGIGESAATWTDAEICVDVTRASAERLGLATYLHASTHGQLDAGQIPWMAATFHEIDVSCDGIASVQDTSRPRRDGEASSKRVFESIRHFAAHGVLGGVRSTVTPANVTKLREALQELASLGVKRLRVEPVYRSASAAFRREDTDGLARELLALRRQGAALGLSVEFASPRLDELHGPYCETHRQALRIRADGTAVNCFLGRLSKSTDGRRLSELPTARFDFETGAYTASTDAGRAFRLAMQHVPETCNGCLCRYHCTRGCPDTCLADPFVPAASFRCQLQQSLALGTLWQTARSC